jgi:hypothetical protein
MLCTGLRAGALITLSWASLLLCLPGCPDSGGTVECGPPVVDAGEDQSASVGATVILRGSARLDPEDQPVCVSEKDTLTYEWTQFSGPDVTLTGADQREASFVPAEAGEYVFHFKATYPVTQVNTGGEKVSQPDSVKVTVESVTCGPPASAAGDDQTLSTPAGTPVRVSLNGTGSHTTNDAGCEGLQLATVAWSVVSQPDGADVTIENADQQLASVSLSVFGEYEFQLSVQDDGGADGRTDTATDTTLVTLLEREGCGALLSVTVTDAHDDAPIAGAEVIVVDNGGASHSQTTDASGLASFSGLAAGNRQSINVIPAETVPALPGTGDAERPRYEATSILDHCSANITVPVYRTASGKAAKETGTIVGKVPASVFDLLPHSWKCAGACSSDSDCDETYYCELSDARCINTCTPRSLLPFFSLGDTNISGQLRTAVLIPISPIDDFSHFEVARMFANPPSSDAVLPGNLASDDTFLNGLATTLGLDPWGNNCVSRNDCPTPDDPRPDDFVCEEDDNGDFRCKDKHPLRNIRMEADAGPSIRMALVTGMINVSMVDLLPILLPMVTGGEEVEFDVGAVLNAFKMTTLSVCPVTLNVAAGTETDITSVLAGIGAGDCWQVDYVARDATDPLLDPNNMTADEACDTDADCCNAGGECGWPQSGKKCFEMPDEPGTRYCFMPMFRVAVDSNDRMTLSVDVSDFDPTAVDADPRLCGFLPATAEWQQLCDNEGIEGPCDPPIFHELDVPANTECSFPYGLAMVGIDFPPGHPTIPEGGRVGIGFDFNRSPFSDNLSPPFLVPSLTLPELQGASVSAIQMYMRRIAALDDMSYQIMPGVAGAFRKTSSSVSEMPMPAFHPIPAASVPADTGISVTITFVPEDATVAPPVIERTFAVIDDMLVPASGANDMPATATFTASADAHLVGLTLARVNRDADTGDNLVDAMWRVYARPGTTSIALPAAASPFASGQEVWITFWSHGFSVSFDYDLFSTEQVLRGAELNSEDGYPVIVP